MDMDTFKQVYMQPGLRRHRTLEQVPSIQTLGSTIVTAPSRDYQHDDQPAADEQELIDLSRAPEASAEEHEQTVPDEQEWRRHDRQDRKCIIIEAAVASVIVIGIVLGAVLGTQLRSHSRDSAATTPSPSPTNTTGAIVPSAETVPVGATFNTSISVGGANCSGTATCGSSAVGGYTAGVSQNLYGSTADSEAWPCGTCWRLTTLWGVTNSSSIVVTVVTDCPATKGNDLCLMQDLDDQNVHQMNVDFNLCPDSGAQSALLGSEGLGLGEAMRVNC